MSKEIERQNRFEDRLKKKVVKNALALGAQFLTTEKLNDTEKAGIKAITEYFSKNEGDCFFASPVIENERLVIVFGILKQESDGNMTVIKQIPVKINKNEYYSIPVNQLINSVLRSEIDIFNLFSSINEKEEE